MLRSSANAAGNWGYAVAGVDVNETKSYFNVALNGDLNPAQPDSITVWSGNRGPLPEDTLLIEIGNATQEFSGTLDGNEVILKIVEFAGLTPNADQLRIQLTTGGVVVLDAILTETAPASNRFLLVQTRLVVGETTNDPGVARGSFRPVMLRLSGTATLLESLRNPQFTVFGTRYSIERNGTDYFAVDSSGNKAIFVAASTAPLEGEASPAENVHAIYGYKWSVGIGWQETGEDAGGPPKATADQKLAPGLYINGALQNPDPNKTAQTDEEFADLVRAKATTLAGQYAKYNDNTAIPIGQEMFEKMVGDKKNRYDFASAEILTTEIKLRQAIVDSAVALSTSRVVFAGAGTDMKVNTDYWQERTPTSGLYFILKAAPQPDIEIPGGGTGTHSRYQKNLVAALNDLRVNGEKYKMECGMFIGAIWLKAFVDAAVKEKGWTSAQVDTHLAGGWFVNENLDEGSNRAAIVVHTKWFDPLALRDRLNCGMLAKKSAPRDVALPGDRLHDGNWNWIHLGRRNGREEAVKISVLGPVVLPYSPIEDKEWIRGDIIDPAQFLAKLREAH
jgi:hypothetical protein